MLRVATAVVLAPCAVAAVSQVAILAIPGCNPNPYALGRCSIGSANLAAPLLIGLLGGLYVAAALGAFVSVPLFLVARWRRWASGRGTKAAEEQSQAGQPKSGRPAATGRKQRY